MKSHLRSVGKYFLIMSLPGLTACGMMEYFDGPRPSVQSGLKKSDRAEVSIKEDQKKIEELRKNIPPERRRENDALAESLALLGEVKHPPQYHRDRFNRLMRNMRQQHQREMRKSRDDFNRNERREREKFLSGLQKERDQFSRRKKVEERDRKNFFDDQDQRRSYFFANERDKRSDFDSAMTVKERDFEAMYQERVKDFDYEYQIYVDRYNEWQRQIREERLRSQSEPRSEGAYEPLKAGD